MTKTRPGHVAKRPGGANEKKRIWQAMSTLQKTRGSTHVSFENQRQIFTSLQTMLGKGTQYKGCTMQTLIITAWLIFVTATIIKMRRSIRRQQRYEIENYYKMKRILERSKAKLALLGDVQRHMRDPERTLVCDILANGSLLRDEDGTRYGFPTTGTEHYRIVKEIETATGG